MNRQKALRFSLFIIIAAPFFVGADGCEGPKQGTAQKEMAQIESQQAALTKAVPPPRLQTSLERKNLVRRLERLNKEDSISYIYLVSYGKLMAYYTVRGKVSSLNSYLTAMEQVVKLPSGQSNTQYEWVTIEAPDHDGSYGKNSEGIFFFTTEGAYVEWKGEYMWSDQPLKMSQPPELIQNVTPTAPASGLAPAAAVERKG
jgi:hypothetical protein